MHWFMLVFLWGIVSYTLATVIPDIFHLRNVGDGFFWTVAFFIGIIFTIWGVHIERRNAGEKIREENHKKEKENSIKQSLLETYGLPIDCPSFQYLNGYSSIPNKASVNIWVGENSLNLLINGEDIQKYQVPIDNINFYSVKGDMKQEMETKGGNMSVGGTVIAEGMLGTAAAMKKNQVVQNIKTIDERKTIINAIVDGKNSFIFFDGADLYNYLLENLPEKEQSFVAMNK
jgi:hypothetical protein